MDRRALLSGVTAGILAVGPARGTEMDRILLGDVYMAQTFIKGPERGLLARSRRAILDRIIRQGASAQEAEAIYDKYVKADLLADLPELRARCAEIVVKMFSEDELMTWTIHEAGPASHRFAEKEKRLLPLFQAAASDWSLDVAVRGLERAAAALSKAK